MILIIGLGNPETKYKDTRHNIGFKVLDSFVRKMNTNFTHVPEHSTVQGFVFEKKLNADVATGMLNEHTFTLLKPQTYMNRSGEAIKAYLDFYKKNPDQVIVIHDDLDLPFGQIKYSVSNGSGGNKGIESIMQHNPNIVLSRLRIGIDNRSLDVARELNPKERKDKAVGDFVLSSFSLLERLKLKSIINQAVEKLLTAL